MHFLLLIAMLFGFVPAETHVPCKTEDSVSCHWNGEQRGNNTGDSFLYVDGELNYYRSN